MMLHKTNLCKSELISRGRAILSPLIKESQIGAVFFPLNVSHVVQFHYASQSRMFGQYETDKKTPQATKSMIFFRKLYVNNIFLCFNR